MHPIISSNRYLTLAVSNKQGDVWASPLAYVFDNGQKVFYFYSDQDSKHCRYLAENPKAAVTIFDSTTTSADALGLQFEVDVQLVEENELEAVMALYFEQSFPDPEIRKQWQRPIDCFSGNASQRFYKVVPVKGFINANEDMIDYREEIDLESL